MTTVTTCSNPAEAELLKSLLDEEGIPAFVPDELFGGIVRVQVDDKDAEKARAVIASAEVPPENEAGTPSR